MGKRFLLVVGRFIIKIIFTEFTIFIFTGMICWLGGWHTLSEFGNCLIYVGFVAMAFGAGSMLGAMRMAKDPKLQYLQSISPDHLNNRSQQHMSDRADSYTFMILMSTAGIISMALGTWLEAF
jgi:hypothetical protein